MIRFPFRAGSARAAAGGPGQFSAATRPANLARDQLMLVRRRAQPAAAYIVRLTGTAVFAYLLALELTGSFRPVLAPLTALLVAQATLFQTIRSAVQRVGAVTAGVLAAVAVAAYVPFSWWVLGLLTAGTLALGMVLRVGSELLEVPISAMLIFSVDSNAAATSRIADTLIGAVAGLAAGLLFAPLRVQPAKEAVGDLTRQMSDLLGEMASGLAEVPEPRRATEWLESTRALRGEIERLDEALGNAEDSIRLNPRRLLLPNPAAGLREGVDTLERAATDMRVLARSVADSARIDSADSPVRDDDTRAQLAAVLGELSAAIRAYGQLVEAGAPAEVGSPSDVATPPVRTNSVPAAVPDLPGPSARLRQHLAEARRRQDDLDHLLRTDPEERPDGWPLRGEILNHVDRLRTELEPARLGASPGAKAGRPPYRSDSTGPMRALGRRVRARRTGSAQRAEKGAQVRG